MTINTISNPSAVLEAQNAYKTNQSQKMEISHTQINPANQNAQQFHKIVEGQFNKFATMSPNEIMTYVKSQNNVATTRSPDVASSLFKDLTNTIRKDEEVRKRAIRSEASMTEIIAATTEASTSLKTAIAVRNKVLEAFEKIMNMQI